MELSYAQKLHMHQHGFVQIPGVVPRVMINAALRAMNHSVGEGMRAEDMESMRVTTYCNELTGKSVVTDLFNATPAFALAESLLGKGNMSRGDTDYGQIALRFPGYPDETKLKVWPHIDGIHYKGNGVPPGVIHHFTLIACILLSDVPEPHCGNFTVWPGAHHRLAAYAREQGFEQLMLGKLPIELPEPLQITGKAGDLIFAHHLLAHGAANNLSPHIRYACFFRIWANNRPPAKETGPQYPEAMLNPWLEFPGLREIVAG